MRLFLGSFPLFHTENDQMRRLAFSATFLLHIDGGVLLVVRGRTGLERAGKIQNVQDRLPEGYTLSGLAKLEV